MPDRQYRAPSAEEAVNQFTRMLEVQPLTGDEEAHVDDRFLAPVFEQAFWRVFGGQVLAQGARAAMQTVEAERAIHSVHGYFLRPGDSTKPIELQVERLRDGGSFSARRCQAYQEGKPILSMIASFQRPSPGPAHQSAMPANIPAPEELAAPEELVGHVKHPVVQEWGRGRPFEIRHVDRPVYLEADRHRRPTSAAWMRTRTALPDDPAVHRAALLYASDYLPFEPIMRQHGLYWAKPGLKLASLDHALWWHRDARADEWLLFVMDSPSTQSARGLSQGSVFSADGALVATFAQEGMVRPPQGMRPRIAETVQRVGARPPREVNEKYAAAWRSRYMES
ncbi:acyl-CoA thioesterase [Nesterenkonia alba]|uniref:acyl-CoA thioesterase n=1 Tax=Nesterenkonia alba TaxID=515814 RepID=UPI0003B35A1A|nr:acyl-CoA thioesterase II [Nesterenkonia alba]